MDKVSEVERSGQQTLAALSTLDAIKVTLPGARTAAGARIKRMQLATRLHRFDGEACSRGRESCIMNWASCIMHRHPPALDVLAARR